MFQLNYLGVDAGQGLRGIILLQKDRTILLVDMNSFFASVEQQCNPALQGKPVLVGGSVSKRSVVAAASYEARPYGIHTGMSLVEALSLCPEAVLVEGNSSKYVDASHRVFHICGDYTDQMEIYSIDECFLDVTDTQSLFGGAWEIARAIKRRVRAEMKLTCSVGIGPNKILAKLASGMQKPDGLTQIRREDVRGILEKLPVEKLHGVGGSLQARLAKMGIFTAGDLGRASQMRLRREFGVMGDVLHEMGNGIYSPPVLSHLSKSDAKSMGHSYTLDRNTRDWSIVYKHLLRLSEMVGWRLREGGYSGRTISLVLRYADMHTFSRQKSLPEYLDDGYAIYKAALSILRQQDHDKRAVRLVGVCASNLIKGTHQLSLFEDPRWRDVLAAMDSINGRYGEFTVMRAKLIGLKTRAKTHGFDGKTLS